MTLWREIRKSTMKVIYNFHTSTRFWTIFKDTGLIGETLDKPQTIAWALTVYS